MFWNWNCWTFLATTYLLEVHLEHFFFFYNIFFTKNRNIKTQK